MSVFDLTKTHRLLRAARNDEVSNTYGINTSLSWVGRLGIYDIRITIELIESHLQVKTALVILA